MSSLPPIKIISERKSPRLTYTLDWLFRDVYQRDYTISDENTEAPASETIYYGKGSDGYFTIPDAGLLWEQGINQQQVNPGTWNDLPVFFQTEGSPDLPYDIFSAIFFFISRYEEYYPFTPDKYGRYPATDSVLFKQGILQRPIVDEWINMFTTELNKKGFNVSLPSFRFLPTYDIDIAYSYKHKGFIRIAGGIAKGLSVGNFSSIRDRVSVLLGLGKDPYDAFEWLNKIHLDLNLWPVYFILAALKNTAYDKNISPDKSSMRQVILDLSSNSLIGLHPSFFSDQEEVFLAERMVMEGIIGHEINKSRQHYIRLKLPETYRSLIRRGVKEDFSMGYGTRLGFRAGTGRSFNWFDLGEEKVTSLRIHPFCFMDTTARFEEGLNAKEAFDLLELMKQRLADNSSQLITVFHNFSIGTDKEWPGWQEQYGRFLKNVMSSKDVQSESL
jgi:hypothetical protein